MGGMMPNNYGGGQNDQGFFRQQAQRRIGARRPAPRQPMPPMGQPPMARPIPPMTPPNAPMPTPAPPPMANVPQPMPMASNAPPNGMVPFEENAKLRGPRADMALWTQDPRALPNAGNGGGGFGMF